MKLLQGEAAAKIQFGLARACDFERLSIDDIKAIKSDDSVTHYRFVERSSKEDTTDEEKRTVIDIASSEHVDSMGDIIKAAGWDLVRLKVGRIPLIGSHNPDPVPYGLVLSANKRAKCDDGVRCLETKSRFHEPELYGDSEWGKHVDAIRTLVMRGEYPGRSVGLVPKAYHWPDDEERDANGQPRYGMVFDEQELLELTVTCIPANNRAQQRKSVQQFRSIVREMVQAGTIDKDVADSIVAQFSAGEEALLRRIQQHTKTIVPLSRELPWLAGGRKDGAQVPAMETIIPVATGDNTPVGTSTPTPAEVPTDAKEVVEAIQRAAKDAIADITKANRDALAALRRDLIALTTEILEPVEAGIEDAADRLEAATEQLGLNANDSDRAEGSPGRAPNGAASTSAVSTGTSRDNPTKPKHAPTLAEALVSALDPANRGTDTAHDSQALDRTEGARR